VRILLVSDVYFPRVNGVSTSIQTFAQQFLALGHEVTLIAPSYATEAEERFPIHRIPSRPVPFDAEDHLMQRAHMRRIYPEIARRKPDLVHIQTPFAAHYCCAWRHGVSRFPNAAASMQWWFRRRPC